MIGPHWMGVVMTIGVILGGTMMNLRIIKHSQPISPAKLLALHVFIAIFCSLSILLLLLTATTDPGIVYPNLDDYDTQLLGNLPGRILSGTVLYIIIYMKSKKSNTVFRFY